MPRHGSSEKSRMEAADKAFRSLRATSAPSRYLRHPNMAVIFSWRLRSFGWFAPSTPPVVGPAACLWLSPIGRGRFLAVSGRRGTRGGGEGR